MNQPLNLSTLNNHNCGSCLTTIKAPGICAFCTDVFEKGRTLMLLAKAEYNQGAEYTYKGRTLRLVEWSKELGMNLGTLSQRLLRMSTEEAFEKPVREHKPYARQK